jgi:hypothetical protein
VLPATRSKLVAVIVTEPPVEVTLDPLAKVIVLLGS